MERYRQTVDEILKRLSPVATTWRDEHADAVIRQLMSKQLEADLKLLKREYGL